MKSWKILPVPIEEIDSAKQLLAASTKSGDIHLMALTEIL